MLLQNIDNSIENNGELYGSGYQNPLIAFIIDKPFVAKGALLQSNVGIFINQIINCLNISEDSIYITYAHKQLEIEKANAALLKQGHSSLVREIKEINPSVVVCLGADAVRAFYNDARGLKKSRYKVFNDHDLHSGVTFSLSSVYVEPSMLQHIIGDVDWLLQNYLKKDEDGEQYDIRIVKDNETFNEFCEWVENKDYLGFDCETNGLNPFYRYSNLLCCAISDAKRCYVFNFNHRGNSFTINRNDLIDLGAILISRKIIGHNIKFDYIWLMQEFKKWLLESMYERCKSQYNMKLCDTKILYNLIDETSPDNSLKALAAKFLNIQRYESDIQDITNLENEDFEKLAYYNGKDAILTVRLFELFFGMLDSEQIELAKTLNKVLKAGRNIELQGLKIDVEHINDLSLDYSQELWKASEALKAIAPNVNPMSAKQLNKLIFDEWNYQAVKLTPTGQPAIDKNVLDWLISNAKCEDHTVFFLNLKSLKKYVKLKSYLEQFQKLKDQNDRIHTSYNVTRYIDAKSKSGTVTGRISSKDPNLQNIPLVEELRNCFTVNSGYSFIEMDYSQLELRVGAFYSQEPKMIEYFKQGHDIHNAVMAEMFNKPYSELMALKKDENHPDHNWYKKHRQIIKTMNFSILYGAGAYKVMELIHQAGIEIDLRDCEELIRKWLDNYPEMKRWIKETQNHIVMNKESLSVSGRVRHLLGANWTHSIGRGLIRQGVNFPIQTTASEICLIALMLIDKRITSFFNNEASIILTVHDSICFEVLKNKVNEFICDVKDLAINGVIEILKRSFGIDWNVPLEIDVKISERWSL